MERVYNEPTYVVTKDLQGETFTIGFNGTAEEFKNKFKRYIQNNPECTAKLESLQGEDIINYIAEIFQLEIKRE